MRRPPPSLNLVPIDERARNGRSQLVFGDVAGRSEFAAARWSATEGWIFASGIPLHFEPEAYQP